MAQNKPAPAHILVIRLSAMGDVAMTVPVLMAFCKAYPEVKITFLTRRFFEPMFAQIPNVAVFTVDVKGKHKGLFGLWRLYKELGKLDIKAVADLHNVLRSNILKSFFKLSAIPFRQIDKGRAEKKTLTRAANKVFEPLPSTCQRYADVFAELGLPVDLSDAEPLEKLPLSPKVRNLMENNSKTKIGIAPFAAFNGKTYPLHLMEEVIKELNKYNVYRLFFFGGGADGITRFNQWTARFENGTNCAGRFSFEDELALISNLDLMLAMDSSNGHLAAMYAVPVITLWGVTHPYAGFAPFGQDPGNWLLADRTKFPLIPTSVYGNKMPEGYEKAVETISPKEIVHKIQEILNKK